MNTVWLKIKVWVKGLLIAGVILYLLVFVIENNQSVTFWWWYNRSVPSSSLLLLLIAFSAGVVSTVLIRTVLRTLRQIKELRGRSRTDRIERDLADMKGKAARLQTKSSASATDVDELHSNLPE